MAARFQTYKSIDHDKIKFFVYGGELLSVPATTPIVPRVNFTRSSPRTASLLGHWNSSGKPLCERSDAQAEHKGSFENTEYPEQSSRVQCVVSFFGPTDISLYGASEGLEEAYMIPWLGKACRTDPSIYKRASPIEYVTKDDPPVLMIHGTVDLIVPIIHSEWMLKKLQDAGVSAELITVKGEGHGWTGPVAAKTTEDAIKFLDAQLKGKK